MENVGDAYSLHSLYLPEDSSDRKYLGTLCIGKLIIFFKLFDILLILNINQTETNDFIILLQDHLF